MKRKQSEGKVRLSNPRCRFCGKFYKPASGAANQRPYCNKCSEDRKKLAAKKFDCSPIRAHELDSKYIIRK